MSTSESESEFDDDIDNIMQEVFGGLGITDCDKESAEQIENMETDQ